MIQPGEHRGGPWRSGRGVLADPRHRCEHRVRAGFGLGRRGPRSIVRPAVCVAPRRAQRDRPLRRCAGRCESRARSRRLGRRSGAAPPGRGRGGCAVVGRVVSSAIGGVIVGCAEVGIVAIGTSPMPRGTTRRSPSVSALDQSDGGADGRMPGEAHLAQRRKDPHVRRDVAFAARRRPFQRG